MFKYLYLDDEHDETSIEGNDSTSSSAIAAALSKTGEITVVPRKPCNFEQQLTEIWDKELSIDGLILDWKLDDNKCGGRKAQYRAASLAQEVRTRAKKRGDFPIILCSTEKRLQGSYSDDMTSHDLFDYKFIKGATDYSLAAGILLELAKGYKEISECKKDWRKMLRLNAEERIDERVFQRFMGQHSYPAHEYANAINQGLIKECGPLISEDVLAARMGIDIEKSANWSALLKKLSECSYTGTFSDAWERWWMHRINNWWGKEVDGQNSLASLNAEERVVLIKKKTSIKRLVAAEPLPKTQSTNFWTICEHFKKPLDPLEGFRMDTPEPLPWQEVRYYSLEAILERHGKVHPSEKERLKYYKQNY